MVPAIRKDFNKSFTKEKYEAFLKDLGNIHTGSIEFRVAETPVFVPKDFTKKMLDACESIVDIIVDPKFKALTENAIPKHLQVPGENHHSHFIAFDFGICINVAGEYEPQLIEMQGFPTLFAYEVLLDDVVKKHFPVPDNYSSYLGKYEKAIVASKRSICDADYIALGSSSRRKCRSYGRGLPNESRDCHCCRFSGCGRCLWRCSGPGSGRRHGHGKHRAEP